MSKDLYDEDWGVLDGALDMDIDGAIEEALQTAGEGATQEPEGLSPVLPPAAFEDGLIDVSTFDFHADVMERLKKGPTLQSFSETAAIWNKYLHLLPSYDEAAIRAEITSWDLDIPARDVFDFEMILEAYARLVSYRNRLAELSGIVNAHHQMLDQAHRNLREIAVKLASGPKHDKDAAAAHATQSFLVSATRAGHLARYLEQVLRSIDFAAVQIDRLMRERQSLARINQSYVNEGQASHYQRQQRDDDQGASSAPMRRYGAPPAPRAPDTDSATSAARRPTIPTRNHRLGR